MPQEITKQVLVNSTMTANYREEEFNGATHIVTEMVPIVGDSVMNQGLYPDSQVEATFNQLDNILAPNGHPTVDGQHVSAYDPAAINANNFGGFIKNPKKSGRVVTCEFWLNKEVAEKTEDGLELIRRIENSEPVGVSTGLMLKQLTANGSISGHDYTWVGVDYKFDHVAILLNEDAAGADFGTELTYNSDQVIMVNSSVNNTFSQLISEMRSEGSNGFISDIDLSGSRAIIEMESGELVSRPFSTSNGVATFSSTETKPVVRSVTYSDKSLQTNQEDAEMPDPKKTADSKELTIDSAIELLEAKGFQVNQKDEAAQADLEFYRTNKAKISALLAADEAKLKELRDNLVANSELIQEEVDAMGEPMLAKMTEMLANKQQGETDHSIVGAGAGKQGEDGTVHQHNTESTAIDYTDPSAFADKA